jgi:hypothetical protein
MKFVIAISLTILVLASSWGLEPKEDAIVGVWLLNDNVKDSSGNGNDGKLNGNFKYEGGKFGKAVVAAGGGSIDVQDSKTIQQVKEELTVAAWFRVDADSDTGVRKNSAYLLEDQSGGEPVPDGFSFRVWTTKGITPGFYGKTELKQKQWHHVVGTYNSKTKVVEMYVDGQPESKKGALSDAKAPWKPEWEGDVTPGSTLQLKFGPESFTGGIDEIVIMSRAITQDEVEQLMRGWEDGAFAVEPQNKLAVNWARIKIQR